MSCPTSDFRLEMAEIFAKLPDSGAAVSICSSAVERGLMTLTDCMTARDMLDIANKRTAPTEPGMLSDPGALPEPGTLADTAAGRAMAASGVAETADAASGVGRAGPFPVGAGPSVVSGNESEGVYALLASMFVCRNRGCLCLPLDRAVLDREIGRIVADRAARERIVENAVAASALPLFTNPDKCVPYPVVFDRGRLYFERYHRHEAGLTRSIRRLLTDCPDGNGVGLLTDPVTGPVTGRDSSFDIESIVNVVSEYAADGVVRNLNNEQKQAVIAALRKRFLVVSGGPGTGKTRLLASLLMAWNMVGIRASDMLLVAPTGRAGRRMAESIAAALNESVNLASVPEPDAVRAMSGVTVHRALGYNPVRDSFMYGPGNRLPHKVVVCDEASMVDVMLMDALLAAVRDDATVVFLGDRDQLPSVEAGAVLGDLVPDQSVRNPAVVTLKTSYRAKGDVLARAGAVNAGRTDAFADMPWVAGRISGSLPVEWGTEGAVCRGIDSGKPGVMQSILASWIDWLYGGYAETIRSFDAFEVSGELSEIQSSAVEKMFACTERGQILCVLRDGPVGASGINAAISEIVARAMSVTGRKAMVWGGRTGVFAGAPLIVLRNSPETGLYNGDTGLVVRSGHGLAAAFKEPGGLKILPLGRLPEFAPAWAVTVHKSQGSEYENVMVCLPESPEHPLLTREIVYTAMTRSRNNVWFAGSREVLESASGRTNVRYSGIDVWETGRI